MAQNGSHSGSWELNYSDHWVKYMNSTHFHALKTKLYVANDFLRLLIHHFKKNVKSHVFLKSEKNVKYVFSNTETDTSANNRDTHGRILHKSIVSNLLQVLVQETLTTETWQIMIIMMIPSTVNQVFHLCLTVCVCVCLSVWLSLSVSVCVCLIPHVYVQFSDKRSSTQSIVCLPVSLCLSICLSVSVCLSVDLTVYVCVCLSCLSVSYLMCTSSSLISRVPLNQLSVLAARHQRSILDDTDWENCTVMSSGYCMAYFVATYIHRHTYRDTDKHTDTDREIHRGRHTERPTHRYTDIQPQRFQSQGPENCP